MPLILIEFVTNKYIGCYEFFYPKHITQQEHDILEKVTNNPSLFYKYKPFFDLRFSQGTYQNYKAYRYNVEDIPELYESEKSFNTARKKWIHIYLGTTSITKYYSVPYSYNFYP